MHVGLKFLLSRNGGDTWAEFLVCERVMNNLFAIGRCSRPEPFPFFTLEIKPQCLLAFNAEIAVEATVLGDPVLVKRHS